MSRNYPTSTQWVTFPTSPKNSAPIKWSEVGHRDAKYYVTKCYWGNLSADSHSKWGVKSSHAIIQEVQKDIDNLDLEGTVKQPKTQAEGKSKQPKPSFAAALKSLILRKHDLSNHPFPDTSDQTIVEIHPAPNVTSDSIVEIKGEVKLFIASEFVEEQFRYGPLLKSYHVKDLSQGKPWITMQLTECFHYGQDGKGPDLQRFLVYHPSIGKGMKSPRMYQHRFTGLAFVELINAGADEVVANTPKKFKAAVAASGKLAIIAAEKVKSGLGYYLNPFLDEYGLAIADFVEKRIAQIETDPGYKRIIPLISLQLVEMMYASKNQDTAEAEAIARRKARLQYARKFKGSYKKKISLRKTLNRFKRKDPSQESIAEKHFQYWLHYRFGHWDNNNQVMEPRLNEIQDDSIQSHPQTGDNAKADIDSSREKQPQDIPHEPHINPIQKIKAEQSSPNEPFSATGLMHEGAAERRHHTKNIPHKVRNYWKRPVKLRT